MAYIRTVAGSGGTVNIDTDNEFTATTSKQHKEPKDGKVFSDVWIDPQQHVETYTPPAISSSNDMGAVHNYRYVDTSGFKKPSGQYSPIPTGTIAEYTYGPYDVTNYKTFYFKTSVSIPKVTYGSFNITTSAETCNCGFEPNFIACTSNKGCYALIYDYRKSTSKYAYHWYKGNDNTGGTQARRTNATIGTSIPAGLKSITSTGFVIFASSNNSDMKGMTVYWVAMRV